MRVGDKLTWTPSGFDHEVSGARADRQRKLRSVTGRIVYIHPAGRYYLVRSVTGRIVYIHPAGRYYLAEALVGGAVIRECFLMKKR